MSRIREVLSAVKESYFAALAAAHPTMKVFPGAVPQDYPEPYVVITEKGVTPGGLSTVSTYAHEVALTLSSWTLSDVDTEALGILDDLIAVAQSMSLPEGLNLIEAAVQQYGAKTWAGPTKVNHEGTLRLVFRVTDHRGP